MAKFRTKEKEDEKTYKRAVTIAQIKFSKPRNSGQNYPKESKIHQGIVWRKETTALKDKAW